jgi:hypothetical protein
MTTFLTSSIASEISLELKWYFQSPSRNLGWNV